MLCACNSADILLHLFLQYCCNVLVILLFMFLKHFTVTFSSHLTVINAVTLAHLVYACERSSTFMDILLRSLFYYTIILTINY